MAEDKRKKKRGRNKVFRSCFRSLAADEASASVNSDGLDSNNGRLAESGRSGKELSPDEKLVNDGVAAAVNGGDCLPKPKPKRPSNRRRFSRIFKAVLFDSKMTKKVRRSSSKSSIGSDTSESCSSSGEKIGKLSEDINASGKECTDMDDNRSHSNLFSSSSRTTLSSTSTSSSSSISRWSSEQKPSSRLDSVDTTQQQQVLSNSSTSSSKKSNPITSTDTLNLKRQNSSISLPSAKRNSPNSITKSSSYQRGLSRVGSKSSVSSYSDKIIKSSGKNGINIRLCLFLLLTLLVLVIWGRIFAILCTSISFYFVPCRRLKRVNSVTNVAESVDLDSDQYKKRVIMAGLLERTRNPLR